MIMIGKGQLTHLKTLISQYAEAREHSYWVDDVYCYDPIRMEEAQAATTNAKRKLDNYIAKLTETDK